MWQIYGQDHITRQLDSALKTGRVSHAYLLVGPPHVGKMALALGMAQAINCLASGPRATRRSPQPLADSPEPDPAAGLFADLDTQPEATSPYLLEDKEVYSQPLTGTADDTGGSVPCGQCSQCQRVAQGVHPDIRIIGVGTGDDEGVNRRDIRIEQVREIESFLNLTPYEGACKVVVVDGAELMNTAAANALLKTLEEPPPESLLLLLTANEDALLPTIRSRCSALYLKPVPKTDLQERLTLDHAADTETAELVARLSRGCFGQAVNALRDYQALEQRQADLERLMQVCQGDWTYGSTMLPRLPPSLAATVRLPGNCFTSGFAGGATCCWSRRGAKNTCTTPIWPLPCVYRPPNSPLPMWWLSSSASTVPWRLWTPMPTPG